MLITHIVLFRFHPGVDWSDARAIVAESVSVQHEFEIDVIREWTVGRDFSRRDISYDFAVIGRFSSADDLTAFRSHPHHQQGVRLWRELAEWVVVDIDTGGGTE